MCSHVLPSASKQVLVFGVVLFCFAPGTSHPHVEQRVWYLFFLACSSDLICGEVSSFLFNCSRSGNLAQLFLLCQPSFRCKVRAKDILCTAWQRLAEVLDHFVTTITNISTNSNITLVDQYTTDFLLTVDDKFPRPLTPSRDPRSRCIFVHHDSHLAL